MRHRNAVPLLLLFALTGCGGSGGAGGAGGGPQPLVFGAFQPAAVILGQNLPTGQTRNNGAGSGNPNATGLDFPSGHVGSGSLYVCDAENNRVLGWNTIPAGSGVAADFVIGAPNFVTLTGGTSASLMSKPGSCWVASNALFVADRNNERVLVWSPLPVGNVPANVALGKPNLTTEGATGGQAGLGQVNSVCVALNHIVVADTGNNRVLVWDGIPAASGANAQLVLGQATFAGTGNGTGASAMHFPSGVWTDGIRLVVADTGNNRVLVWTTFPTANGQPADLVVGQPDFATSTPGIGASKLFSPLDVTSDGFQLFVADSGNNRVLVFTPFPTLSNPTATTVLGQAGFANTAINDDDQDGLQDPGPTGRTFNGPFGVTVVGRQLFVSDRDNNRVLIFGAP